MVKALPVMGLSRPPKFEKRLFLKADFEGNFKKLPISLRRATSFERGETAPDVYPIHFRVAFVNINRRGEVLK